MRPRIPGYRRAALTAFVLIALLVPAAGASAHGLTTGLWDDLYTSPSASTRGKWLDQTVNANAGIVHVYVYWAAIARHRPSNPRSPSDPEYQWQVIDPTVQDAASRGLRVLLTVQAAPPWAEGKNPPPGAAAAGTWKPNANAFGAFGEALARRYSGRYRDASGTLLPRVQSFEAWNEPNQDISLAPQWTKGNHPEGPKLYRRLVNAFYAGVKAGNPSATVVAGATSPYGDPPGGHRTRPYTFLRQFLCLNTHLKATKCANPPHFDAISHHPIVSPVFKAGPSHVPATSKDIEVSNFGEARRLLRAAERAKTIRPGGHHEIWATEFWWFTNPPDPSGVSPAAQAKYIEQLMYMVWKQGASVAINYGLYDPAYTTPLAALTTGLFFHNGTKKPSFQSFRFPFVTHRSSKARVGVWGKAPASGKLRIQQRGRHGWRTVKSRRVHRGQVFTSSLHLRGGARLRGSVGGVTSLTWHQR